MGIMIAKKLEKMIHIVFGLVFGIFVFFVMFHFERYYLGFQHNTIKTILFDSEKNEVINDINPYSLRDDDRPQLIELISFSYLLIIYC